MVKLLMRFYDVDAGSITLNGHNVRDFDRSALREGFGMVLQDTWLFKGTIMENIRYAASMPPTKKSSPLPKPPTQTTSSAPCPAATRWS